jgi:hypothetical protein
LLIWNQVETDVDYELNQQDPNGNHHDVQLEDIVVQFQAYRDLRANLEQNRINVVLVFSQRVNHPILLVALDDFQHNPRKKHQIVEPAGEEDEEIGPINFLLKSEAKQNQKHDRCEPVR